jgi:hypothetical protein
MPTKRLLFRKVTKEFDKKGSLLAKAQLNIQAPEAQLEAARPKRRRKVETRPNSKFAEIKAIQRAQEKTDVAESKKEDGEESEVSDDEENLL